MWRDRLDAFWNGKGTLAVGFFEEEAAGEHGLRPEISISSWKDGGFDDSTLLDVVDAKRWRCGCCVLRVPSGHVNVSLRSPDGAELHLVLTNDELSLHGGEWRLLLTEQPDGSANGAVAFRLAFLSARGDFERLVRDQIARSGAKLVWAICQRRYVERRDGAATLMRLEPTQRVFPAHQSRVVIEAMDEMPVARRSAPLRAPFAIMEHWVSENEAPHPILRVRLPSPIEQSEALLGRTAVFLAMHQRRRFRHWVREQRDAGEAIADLLTFGDIRHATEEPSERPEAVESGSSIIVHNLSKLLAGSESEFDGVSIMRRPNGGSDAGVTAEIDFFGATLGDDVGLVSTGADVGDFGVVPIDPGGVSYARLFRVESDGLEPRRIEDDDPLLGEILRLAADEERGSIGTLHSAERAASLQGRRERLLVGLNGAIANAGFAGRFHAAKLWDIFEPILLTSFVALVEDSTAAARAALRELGGYEAYRADPALVHALIRQHEFLPAQAEAYFRECLAEPKPLVNRLAAACGAPSFVAPSADLPEQIRAWRLLMQTPLVQRLATARIALSGAQELPEEADRTAELLTDEAAIERAAAYCDDLELNDEAKSLRAYLQRRREGEWTSLDEAARLAVIVEEADAYWREIDAGRTATVASVNSLSPEPVKSGGLFATVRSFFSRGSKTA